MSDTSSSSSYKTDIDDISQICIKCPHFYRSVEKHEKYDTVRICSIAISTVMLLARRSYKDITSEHIKYMEMHFRNLKEEDKYPHNITCILEILENLRRSGMIENVKEEEANMETSEGNIPIDDLIN